ncbi:MAG: DUF1684 domain-containing protein [Cyclobacteriaceae bacterium]|nr:DUF1684 domain-containing protein [Cyclobacteriaceae bacterium HetDA_MAG_MS6]
MSRLSMIISLYHLLALSIVSIGQSYEDEIGKFQDELNADYLDVEKSPLTKKDRRKFKGHNFFAIDSTFRVEAELIKIDDNEKYQLKTTTRGVRNFTKYAKAKFVLSGRTFELSVYQSDRLKSTPGYEDYLFLPFTDLTSGRETYGGGRYIDLRIPDDEVLVIDFNKSYHPYCAYNDNYSCIVPPRENRLDTRVEAGVRNLR